ncbi:MAG TPA: GntG family PLP-dependent aldolase, partial [Thermoanaerobaculales bacterium]|nr:GntG family PLP-dependent aldolase [Thermoanaerobaculales bacterium]
MERTIDLRSDTVTQPTPSMRRAMAEATVGDDVYGEDPTVNRLEERAAALMGREAALLVPSGTMANQIAVNLLSRRGQEVIGDARCHIFNFEHGAMAAISGALARPIETADGILHPDQIRGAYLPAGGHTNSSCMVVLENTHNLAGGRVVPAARMDALVATSTALGLPVHLDGARIHNAAAALGVPAARLARGCDTVMFCLSKALGAPVGSLLVGDRALIAEARVVRKMLGGGMRQAGVLAAAGLVALDEVLPRLADDHATARRLASLIAEIPGILLDPATVETNIICFGLDENARVTASELVGRLATNGVLCSALGANLVRLVTHYHVTMDDAEAAAAAVRAVM